jgi:hypothetical protein
MARETVKNYDDVLNSIRAFNKALEHGRRLREQIQFFHSWYYVPELDAVGPSKFIRYTDMTAFEYVRGHSVLEGQVVDPVLAKWFHRLEDDSVEGIFVKQKVNQLLGKYGKIIGSESRFNAPKGWGLHSQLKAFDSTELQVANDVDVANPAIDGVWRAFLALSADDQKAFAERISNHHDLIS